ncbi:hypothetical protein [Actinoplanes sp. NPDC020271]|uniref:hypothetical protein n=1 Tax=Actinoplanes sp. NPDC020271 TaxID=3363896 RepID=UPI0037A8047E
MAFAPEVEDELLLDDEGVEVDEDELLLVAADELSDEELDEVVVLSAFFGDESPDFSALTLPDRESLR